VKMKSVALFFAVCVACAVVFGDDAPEDLFPCSFRMTTRVTVSNTDGELLATSINEIIRDNGDFWAWKSDFEGNEFVRSIIPDHQWSLIWRSDLGKSFRHDIPTQKCYVSTDVPTPYKWIESKTYGIVWFDERVEYEGKEAILYTAVGVGSYNNIDFESTASFYVLAEDRTLVHINGTLSASHKQIEVVFRTDSLYFEHNKPIDPKTFVIQPPCPEYSAPSDPSDNFKKKCYNSSGASQFVSIFALLLAVLAALMSF